jgi:hypothetical protein
MTDTSRYLPSFGKSKRRSLVGKVARVSGLALLLSLGFGAFLARTGQARATDAMVDFGGELLRVGDRQIAGTLERDNYRVVMNGQPIDVATAGTTRSMKEVLTYFEAQCKAHGAGLKTTGLDGTLATLPEQEGPSAFWTMRVERGRRGYVACVATDHEVSGPEEVDRITQAAKTFNLGSLGSTRYIAAEQTPTGTRVVASATDGSFDLKKFAPAKGDAEGLDFPDVPRPEGSRRVLSASVDGAPAAVNVYSVHRDAATVRAEVEASLKAKGWAPALKPPAEVPDLGRAYSRGPFDLITTVNDMGEGKSGVSYAISKMVGTVSVGR